MKYKTVTQELLLAFAEWLEYNSANKTCEKQVAMFLMSDEYKEYYKKVIVKR